MQAEVTAAQAELHGDSEADEGSVAWPDSDEDEEGSQAAGSSRGEEEEEGEDEDAAGAGSPVAQPQQQLQQHSQSQPQRRPSGADLKQVDIRSFFSGRRGSDGGRFPMAVLLWLPPASSLLQRRLCCSAIPFLHAPLSPEHDRKG